MKILCIVVKGEIYMLIQSSFNNLTKAEMIALAIENGQYNWDKAIETLAEKIILVQELEIFDEKFSQLF